MEQLAPFIAWMQRNKFWISCFMVAATSIGIWFFTSNQLVAAQKKRENEIRKRVGELDRVMKVNAEEDGERAHPNKATQAGMDAVIDDTISSIVAGWNERYSAQKGSFQWPKEILGDEATRFFSQIEVVEKFNPKSSRGFEKYLITFYNRIPQFMDKITRELGTNWQYDPEYIKKKQEAQMGDSEGRRGGTPGMGMGMGMGMSGGGDSGLSLIDELNSYPVQWEEPNQLLWQQKLTQFAGYDDNKGASVAPSFLQANMLMQDLWLLEAMFKNIKDINGDSSSNDTSIIRNIDHIAFGREADGDLGVLHEPDPRLKGEVPGEDDAAASTGARGPMGGASMSMAGARGALPGAEDGLDMNAERNPYHGRYVTPDFEKIAAADIRAVIGGEALPEKNLELIVAKRVPFRLGVTMDERKIPEFIALCANSNFVFEINQLRVNRHQDEDVQIAFNGGITKNDSDDGMGMGMGGMGMGGMDMGDMGDMGMGGGGGPSVSLDALESRPVESRINFDVSVEFFGIVKLYNPVRENFLRKAAGQKVVDETVQEIEAPEQPPKVAAPANRTAPAAGAGQAAAGNAQPAGGVAAPIPGAEATPAAAQPNPRPAGAAPTGQAGAPAVPPVGGVQAPGQVPEAGGASQ